MNDLMSQVLFHKPDDIFAFAAEKFNSFERKVRAMWRERRAGAMGLAGNKGNGNAAALDGRRGGMRRFDGTEPTLVSCMRQWPGGMRGSAFMVPLAKVPMRQQPKGRNKKKRQSGSTAAESVV